MPEPQLQQPNPLISGRDITDENIADVLKAHNNDPDSAMVNYFADKLTSDEMELLSPRIQRVANALKIAGPETPRFSGVNRFINTLIGGLSMNPVGTAKAVFGGGHGWATMLPNLLAGAMNNTDVSPLKNPANTALIAGALLGKHNPMKLGGNNPAWAAAAREGFNNAVSTGAAQVHNSLMGREFDPTDTLLGAAGGAAGGALVGRAASSDIPKADKAVGQIKKASLPPEQLRDAERGLFSSGEDLSQMREKYAQNLSQYEADVVRHGKEKIRSYELAAQVNAANLQEARARHSAAQAVAAAEHAKRVSEARKRLAEIIPSEPSGSPEQIAAMLAGSRVLGGPVKKTLSAAQQKEVAELEAIINSKPPEPSPLVPPEVVQPKYGPPPKKPDFPKTFSEDEIVALEKMSRHKAYGTDAPKLYASDLAKRILNTTDPTEQLKIDADVQKMSGMFGGKLTDLVRGQLVDQVLKRHLKLGTSDDKISSNALAEAAKLSETINSLSDTTKATLFGQEVVGRLEKLGSLLKNINDYHGDGAVSAGMRESVGRNSIRIIGDIVKHFDPKFRAGEAYNPKNFGNPGQHKGFSEYLMKLSENPKIMSSPRLASLAVAAYLREAGQEKDEADRKAALLKKAAAPKTPQRPIQ